MNLSTRALGTIVAILLVCCCLTALLSVVVIGGTLDQPSALSFFAPTDTPTATATLTPTRPTATIAPRATDTRVVPLPTPATPIPGRTLTPARATATLPANPYAIVVPTPTAVARLNYPVTFNSAFTVVTYTVAGKTTQDLSRSLDANAIADPHEPGSRYYAQTEWYVSSNWSWKETASGCELDRSSITITITMTLPALTTQQGVAPDALSKWNTFLANTITHEKGHVTRALDGGRDYQRGLGTLPPQSNCNVMRPKLDSMFKYYLDAIDRVNIDYDTETNHGYKQGAVFP